MELIQKTINTNNVKPPISTQITLDDDFNVPDNRSDVEKITVTRGEIEITESETMPDKIKVQGLCRFYVLYTTDLDSYPVSSLSGTIPFEDTINNDGVMPSDSVKIKALLEDLNISIINSRKLSIRALINLKANVSENQQVTAATDVEQPIASHQSILTSPEIACLHNTINTTSLVINKKDICRLREELTIPSNKPNIYEILWSSTNLNNPEVKVLDGSLSLRGDISIFLLYSSEDDTAALQFLELELPFKSELSCENCMEDMVSNISMHITTAQFAIKPDSDGEQRQLDMEAVIELDIKLYEEASHKLLTDAYSPKAEVQLTKEPFHYSHLLVKNNAKTRISKRIKRSESDDPIMQLCHVEGQVKIDEYTLYENGIKVEGVITADVLYISSNDRNPINSTFLMVPFQYMIEMEGVNEQSNFEVTSAMEQLNVTMLDSSELELKATVSLCAIAFEGKETSTIKELDISPLNPEKMQALPSMVGYIVKDGDNLWSIAKRYYTTKESIIKCNHLENEEIHTGDKLIIMK